MGIWSKLQLPMLQWPMLQWPMVQWTVMMDLVKQSKKIEKAQPIVRTDIEEST